MLQGNFQGDLPIHSALKTGELAAVKALTCWIQKNNKAEQVLGWNNNGGRNTALHIALEYDEERIAQDLVELYPPASYVMNKEGFFPLYLAIKKELTDLVKDMLQRLQPLKYDVLGCLARGQSVLHAAVSAKRTEMLEYLLSYDDDKLIDLTDQEGWTALTYAACRGYLKKVEIFQRKVPHSAFICNKDKSFPIHLAVLGGHISIIDQLASTMFLLNAKGQNILHLATLTADSQLVSHLLKNLPGMDSLINQKDEDGNTPLHLATLAKHVEIVEFIIQDGRVNIRLMNKEGFAAIGLAKKLRIEGLDKNVAQRLTLILERAKSKIKSFPIDDKMYQVLLHGKLSELNQMVLDKGFKLKDLGCPEDGNTILHIAASLDQHQLAGELLQRYGCGILMEQANNKGNLPIHSAAKAGKLQSLEALFLGSNFPLDHVCKRPNMEGNTALHIAVLRNHNELANYLYEKCPQAAYCLNKNEVCPLFLAIINWGENDLVNRMIHGLQGNMQLYNLIRGKSVVHVGISAKKSAILESIIEIAPELVDSFDSEGRNPLSYAAHIGYVKGVKLLLAKFPSIKFKRDKDEDGSFPIHHAAKEGHVKIIKLLHPTICLLTNRGQNILHVAADIGKWRVIAYLLKLQEFKELINTGDDDGNTPLHLAVKGFHLRTVARLMKEKHNINSNAINNELSIARQMFCEDEYPKWKIQRMDSLLRRVDGKRTCLIIETRNDEHGHKSKEKKYNLNKQQEAEASVATNKNNDSSSNNTTEMEMKSKAIKEKASFLLVVATLTISATFSATLHPPGGYNHDTGLPLLSSNRGFKVFLQANSLACFCAITSALLLIVTMFMEHKEHRNFTVNTGGIFLYLGLVGMTVGFSAGLTCVFTDMHWNALMFIGMVTTITMVFVVYPIFYGVALGAMSRYFQKVL
ncbi:protein ACCELERATED CELL DEATH 6 isoform X3 [Spinacia oleracea]|nr:protein ACCELERATED CELL DEATH 6-like isoform X3 [Spinacia oleracea]